MNTLKTGGLDKSSRTLKKSDGVASVSPNHDTSLFSPQKKRIMFLIYWLGLMNALNIHMGRNGSILFWKQKYVFLLILFLPCNPSWKAIDNQYSLTCRVNWPEPSAWFHCGWPPSQKAEALLEGWKLSLRQLWLRFQQCLLLLGFCSWVEVVGVTALECHSKI